MQALRQRPRNIRFVRPRFRLAALQLPAPQRRSLAGGRSHLQRHPSSRCVFDGRTLSHGSICSEPAAVIAASGFACKPSVAAQTLCSLHDKLRVAPNRYASILMATPVHSRHSLRLQRLRCRIMRLAAAAVGRRLAADDGQGPADAQPCRPGRATGPRRRRHAAGRQARVAGVVGPGESAVPS